MQAQVLPLGVVREQRLAWRIKPVWRPELQDVAGQAQEWIFETAQGLITGSRLKLGLAQGLRLEWGPNVASELEVGLQHVLGQVQGQPSGYGLGLRESYGLVLDLGFAGSELWQTL